MVRVKHGLDMSVKYCAALADVLALAESRCAPREVKVFVVLNPLRAFGVVHDDLSPFRSFSAREPERPYVQSDHGSEDIRVASHS